MVTFVRLSIYFFLIVMHAFVCALVGNVHLTFCICATVSGSCSVCFSSLPFLNKNKGRTHIDIGIIMENQEWNGIAAIAVSRIENQQ